MPKPKIDGRFCTYCTPSRLEKGLQPKRANHMHEQFPATKDNLRIYGAKLIYDPKNCFPACVDCNTSHAGEHLIIWDEFKFCEVMKEIPRSKEASIRKLRERNYK